jgi:uncharacterized protein YegL
MPIIDGLRWLLPEVTRTVQYGVFSLFIADGEWHRLRSIYLPSTQEAVMNNVIHTKVSLSLAQSNVPILQPGNFAPGQDPVISGIGQITRLKTYNEQPVHLILDDSGSMCGAKAAEASNAGNVLLAELADHKNKDGFRINLIRFGSSSTLEASSAAPESINVAISGSSGGTAAEPALRLAQNGERTFIPRTERRRVPGIVVFMSDGQLGDRAEAMRVADELKRDGVTIITVGFGSDADVSTLKNIASTPDHYAFAAVGGLANVFAKVGKTISQQLGKAP